MKSGSQIDKIEADIYISFRYTVQVAFLLSVNDFSLLYTLFFRSFCSRCLCFGCFLTSEKKKTLKATHRNTKLMCIYFTCWFLISHRLPPTQIKREQREKLFAKNFSMLYFMRNRGKWKRKRLFQYTQSHCCLLNERYLLNERHSKAHIAPKMRQDKKNARRQPAYAKTKHYLYF